MLRLITLLPQRGVADVILFTVINAFLVVLVLQRMLASSQHSQHYQLREKKSLSQFPFPAILYIEKYFSSTFLVTANRTIYGAKEKKMPSSKHTFITGNISMNVKSIIQITSDHKKNIESKI